MSRWVCICIGSVLAIGCTHTKELEKRVADLQTRLDEIAGTTRASRLRMESLENRILLLQDEVETLKMSSRRGGTGAGAPAPAAVLPPIPPELPTVRLTPSRPPEEARPAPPTSLSPAAVQDESVFQEIDDEGNVVPAKGARATAERSRPSRGETARPARPPRDTSPEDAVLKEYQAALDLYHQGRVAEAKTAFETFVKRYPRHPYADNAQYWVGECLYDQKDFEGARREFTKVFTEHPDGNKVPDAMVKVGLCDRALGRNDDALRMFHTVMLTFPDTEAAQVAMRLAGEAP